MSADNAYFVIEKNGEYSVSHGFMSPFCEQNDYPEHYGPDNGYTRSLFDSGKKFSSRAEALEYAHDCVKEDYIVEYGVVEEKIQLEV